MISVYREGRHGLQSADGFEKGAWIHVEDPSEEEVALLHQELGIPHKFLVAALDPREVARTDSRRDYHMIIVRAPYDFGKHDRVPYRTVPLAIINAPNHFLTISKHPIDFVRDLNYSYDEGELQTRRANRMIVAILGIVGEWYLRYLDELDRSFEDVENRLVDSIANSEMLELLRYEKSLIYMKTGLEWNDRMVEHVQSRSHFGWSEEDVELLEDVQIEYRQGFYMAETMATLLGETTDAFASLISNNLNVVMKFLAAVTIILTVPMIVASFYGMNVSLPAEGVDVAFILILALAFVLALAVAWWFKRQGWLSFRWRRGQGEAFRHAAAPEGDNADA